MMASVLVRRIRRRDDQCRIRGKRAFNKSNVFFVIFVIFVVFVIFVFAFPRSDSVFVA